MNIPKFGGPWTQEKLEILRRYLDTYTTALKNQPFALSYIDAFAGAGMYIDSDHDRGEFEEFHEGSTKIALDISDRQFDHLVFIEENSGRIESLKELANQHPGRGIRIIEGNANLEIPKFCNNMGSSDRAVVFLDPFATEVSWDTVKAIASTQKIDCWILFPLMAITRMMPRGREPDTAMSERLDRIFGGREYWRRSYRDSLQIPLFDNGQRREREQGNDEIANNYRDQLRTVFHRVAEPRRTLRNSKNGPLFELFFAAGNPQGANTAIRIANYILENW